jgi:hypothetical protein
MPEPCPKCGATNPPGRSTCIRCGAELEVALFAEMFGPPRLLKGRYATQRPIRQGSTVSLYQARDTKDGNRPCLIHQVSLTALDRDRQELIEHRFLQEAATWQTRQHPNIIRILDADVQHHRLYLITEPIVGTSLRSIIQDRRQAVPEATLVQWADQLCDALHYLHTSSPPVVLGCISPATLHVDPAGRLQLIEVGLIRYRQSGLIGPAKGVSGYAAPEQRKGQVTLQSDLYTVGIILYQIITRHDPRDRPLPSLRKQASSFSDGRALSASFLSAVARAYRRDPEKRFASAAEMREALLGASPQPAFELALPDIVAPLELEAGLAVNTVPALVRFCATHWEEGLSGLITGRIVEWLSTAAEALRESGPEPVAHQTEQAAQRAAEARQQMIGGTAQARRAAAAQDIARNAAYAAWLRDMGAVGIQPSLQVRPLGFDFGVVGATIKAKSTLHIQNRGQGYLTGRVESRVPWLTIPSPLFGCRAGETAEVPIEARGRNLQTGESHSPQALRVLSNGGEMWIEARAAASPPILSVRPQTLDYGLITRGASRIVQLTVANRGGGRLAGQVLSQAPYLRVRYPSFSCSAGASAQIDVELLSDRLPRGAVRIRKALAVDSDSGQARVDVAWKWARPALELDTTGLDLGSVQRGAQIERTLTLSNGGTADLVGTARSQVDWLTVLPAEFRCAPGASQTLTVLCDTRRLPGGSTVEAEALVIEANADRLHPADKARPAGRQVLSASIEVLAARLVVEPYELDLGTVLDGEPAEETLVVGNRGSLPWEGRIRARVPWLTVEPGEIRCDPGHFVPVSVLLKTEELETGGEWHAPQAILIGEGEQQQDIAVHVTLARPRLDIERRSLDFGLIGRTEVETLPLQITNGGNGQLEWRIGVRGTWLEVIPSEGTCDAGETAPVQVNAYALAVDGDSGRGWLTVHSNGGRVDMPASVALSSPALSVEPLTVELESENYAEATQTIRLSNRGVGLLSGTIRPQVPWLTCEPQTFVCETGAATQIQISADLEHLRAHEQAQGTQEAPDALVVNSNAGTQEIGARLTLHLTARLHLAPQELRLSDTTEAEFQLENQGYGTLRVHLTPSEPWITVNRQEWTIKARKRARVRVRLVDAPENGQGSIEIRTPDTVTRLPVQSAG